MNRFSALIVVVLLYSLEGVQARPRPKTAASSLASGPRAVQPKHAKKRAGNTGAVSTSAKIPDDVVQAIQSELAGGVVDSTKQVASTDTAVQQVLRGIQTEVAEKAGVGSTAGGKQAAAAQQVLRGIQAELAGEDSNSKAQGAAEGTPPDLVQQVLQAIRAELASNADAKQKKTKKSNKFVGKPKNGAHGTNDIGPLPLEEQTAEATMQEPNPSKKQPEKTAPSLKGADKQSVQQPNTVTDTEGSSGNAQSQLRKFPTAAKRTQPMSGTQQTVDVGEVQMEDWPDDLANPKAFLKMVLEASDGDVEGVWDGIEEQFGVANAGYLDAIDDDEDAALHGQLLRNTEDIADQPHSSLEEERGQQEGPAWVSSLVEQLEKVVGSQMGPKKGPIQALSDHRGSKYCQQLVWFMSMPGSCAHKGPLRQWWVSQARHIRVAIASAKAHRANLQPVVVFVGYDPNNKEASDLREWLDEVGALTISWELRFLPVLQHAVRQGHKPASWIARRSTLLHLDLPMIFTEVLTVHMTTPVLNRQGYLYTENAVMLRGPVDTCLLSHILPRTMLLAAGNNPQVPASTGVMLIRAAAAQHAWRPIVLNATKSGWSYSLEDLYLAVATHGDALPVLPLEYNYKAIWNQDIAERAAIVHFWGLKPGGCLLPCVLRHLSKERNTWNCTQPCNSADVQHVAETVEAIGVGDVVLELAKEWHEYDQLVNADLLLLSRNVAHLQGEQGKDYGTHVEPEQEVKQHPTNRKVDRSKSRKPKER